MTDTKIRDMTPADIPSVVDMITALSAFHNATAAVTPDTLARDTDPTAPWMYITVAEREAQLVGYMVLLPLAKIADGLRGIDINHMYVAPDHRGTGIGRRLIDAAKAKATALSCSYMFISTAHENTAAQNAYLACGFDAHPDAGGPRFRMQI